MKECIWPKCNTLNSVEKKFLKSCKKKKKNLGMNTGMISSFFKLQNIHSLT